jgi:hypothetical protein
MKPEAIDAIVDTNPLAGRSQAVNERNLHVVRVAVIQMSPVMRSATTAPLCQASASLPQVLKAV